MRLDELDFAYPEELVATERRLPSRVMLVVGERAPRELADARALLEHLRPHDVLAINDTRVLRRRVFAQSGLEILFLQASDPSLREWDVLCPSSRWKDGEQQALPGGVRLKLVARGKPQRVCASLPLDEAYFEAHGELPLPPYIQRARAERNNRAADASDYQTAWAERDGSLAAPTASLHFSADNIRTLEARGVKIARLTLHVGLGTFLPITAATLDEHAMHGENVEIPSNAWRAIADAHSNGGRVWAMGTTAARALESAAHGLLASTPEGGFSGSTELFIRPGFEYKSVDCLMTNFHQPKSTLLALLAAFAPGGLAQTKACYRWAIENKFKLFSYGDLSAWIR